MPQLVSSPTVIPVPGGKRIEEFIGRVNTGETSVSIARMVAPAGWDEPAQRPAFDEFTLVLDGQVVVEHDGGSTVVEAGQAVITRAGERIRYTSPTGATYVAVCLPAFTPETVNRDVE